MVYDIILKKNNIIRDFKSLIILFKYTFLCRIMRQIRLKQNLAQT